MALYEYICETCQKGKPYRFELRMPMKDVVQFTACPRCGKQAKKAITSFAFVGLAQPGYGDGPPPWENPMGGDDHGHSHGGDGMDMGDDF